MIGKIQNVSFAGLKISQDSETEKALKYLTDKNGNPNYPEIFEKIDVMSGGRNLELRGEYRSPYKDLSAANVMLRIEDLDNNRRESGATRVSAFSSPDEQKKQLGLLLEKLG